MGEDWFTTGYDGVEPPKTSGRQASLRYWRKSDGEYEKALFASNEPFVVYEHQVKIAGDWRNWFTCRKGMEGGCPICDAAGKVEKYFRYQVGLYTVIDRRGYTDKEGKKHEYTVRILPVKKKQLNKFKMKSKDLEKRGVTKGGLKGCQFLVARSDGDKIPSIGDDWEFDKVVDLEKEFSDVTEFDFRSMFFPQPVEELEKVARGITGGGEEEVATEESDDTGWDGEDIPF